MNSLDIINLPDISIIELDVSHENKAIIKLNDIIITESTFVFQYYSAREQQFFQYKNIDDCIDIIKRIKHEILSNNKSFIFKYSQKMHNMLYF